MQQIERKFRGGQPLLEVEGLRHAGQRPCECRTGEHRTKPCHAAGGDGPVYEQNDRFPDVAESTVWIPNEDAAGCPCRCIRCEMRPPRTWEA